MPSAGRRRPGSGPPGRSDGAWITPAARCYKHSAPPELPRVLERPASRSQPQRGDLFIARCPPQGHSAPAERHGPPSEPLMPSAGRGRPGSGPPGRSDGSGTWRLPPISGAAQEGWLSVVTFMDTLPGSNWAVKPADHNARYHWAWVTHFVSEVHTTTGDIRPRPAKPRWRARARRPPESACLAGSRRPSPPRVGPCK